MCHELLPVNACNPTVVVNVKESFMRSRATVVAVSAMVAVLMLAGMANAAPRHNTDTNHGRDDGRGVVIKGEVGEAPNQNHPREARNHRRAWKPHKSRYFREVRYRHGHHSRHDVHRGQGGWHFRDPSRPDETSDALRYVGSRNRRFSDADYLRADPFIVTKPQRGTTLSGWLDLSDGVPGSVATIGLVDLASLRDGQSGRQEGAFIYVYTMDEDTVRIGVTDGNDGGELVQNFEDVTVDDDGKVRVEFTIDGGADPEDCGADADVDAAEGCMTLVVDGGEPITDSYGSITAEGFEDEFARGAVPGWEAYPEDGSSTGIKYRLRVAPAASR